MAMSDYALCDSCGRKVIYTGHTTVPDGALVFCDGACMHLYAKAHSAPAPATPTKAKAPRAR